MNEGDALLRLGTPCRLFDWVFLPARRDIVRQLIAACRVVGHGTAENLPELILGCYLVHIP